LHDNTITCPIILPNLQNYIEAHRQARSKPHGSLKTLERVKRPNRSAYSVLSRQKAGREEPTWCRTAALPSQRARGCRARPAPRRVGRPPSLFSLRGPPQIPRRRGVGRRHAAPTKQPPLQLFTSERAAAVGGEVERGSRRGPAESRRLGF